MLFVSAEKSKMDEVSTLLKTIYKGAPKSYPNGSMMLLIPIHEIQPSSTNLRTKTFFNHEKDIGNATLFSIGGFNDLTTEIKPKNGKVVTLCHLLKSISASNGMTCPQLFQQAETNIAAVTTIVTFQAQDWVYVLAHWVTLEAEIHQVIVEGKETKVFTDDVEGIWFGSANNSKSGRLTLIDGPTNKKTIEYVSHINRMMNSPPKKRLASTPAWGGGIPTSIQKPPATWSPPSLSSTSTTQPLTTAMTVFDQKFDVIYSKMTQQHLYNANFNERISSLETTTQSIDSKINKILNSMESIVQFNHKIQRTQNSTPLNGLSHPGHPITNSNLTGPLQQCLN